MRKELLILALLVLVIGCTSAPIAPVQESPAPVASPAAPVTTPSAPPANTTPVVNNADCKSGCMSRCAEDDANACGFAADYDQCVDYCGTSIRPQGCKGACATGVPIECSIIFEKECEKDCTKACA